MFYSLPFCFKKGITDGKSFFHPCLSAEPLAVDICHYRDSSIEELSRLGNNGNHFSLAQYRGELYYLRPYTQPPCCLCHHLKVVHQVYVDEIEALFEAYFEVRYRGNWYPCSMIGGITQNPRDICVVAEDPENQSGLGSRHNSHMWGDGVEMDCQKIEAVRLCLSNPIDPRVLNP